MKKRIGLSDKIYFVFVLVFVVAQQAHAYLDPGTGSLVIQILIAGFAGAIYAVKLQWNNLKNFFIRVFSNNK